jgi:hypothetical protein
MIEMVRRSTTCVPLRRFLGDVRRELMQRLSVVLRGTLGSYLRDALREGVGADVACLRAPRAQASLPPLHSPLFLVDSTTLFVIKDLSLMME